MIWSSLTKTSTDCVPKPTPSGYLSQYSWRWPFWFALIFAGTCAVPIVFLPETFGPTILAKRARKMREQNPDANTYGALELKKVSPRLFVTTVLGRPLRMILTEPIVAASCLYLSLIYAVFFMLVQVYPIIFERKMSSSSTKHDPLTRAQRFTTSTKEKRVWHF